jgi:hypothetical protein
MTKIQPPSITYTLSVSVTVALNEDFTDENAEARDTQRDIEKSVYRHLETWGRVNHCPVYNPSVDVELTDYDITMPNPREKGDDDGVEYGHPGDRLAGRE